MALNDLLQTLGRPTGTAPGKEIGIWWRLAYRGGLYITEHWQQESIRLAPRGAVALQLVTRPDTPEGNGVLQVPLESGERPIFYRARSIGMNNGETASRVDAIVYGKVREINQRWNSELRAREVTAFNGTVWAVIPGKQGLEQPVPQRWIDLAMINAQYEG